MFLAPDYLDRALTFAPLIFIAAFLVWGLGLLVIGVPAWIALARSGQTAPSHALLLGLLASFFASVALNLALTAPHMGLSQDGRVLIENGWRTPYGWFLLIKDSVLLGLLGGVVATVIWRIAYRTERSNG